MSAFQTLRVLVTARLTAAAEEIFALFEGTIAEFEEELRRSKEENQRKQERLDSVLNPRVERLRADLRTTESPGPGLDQGLEPGLNQIKDEPEEQMIKQEEDSVPVPEFGLVCGEEECSDTDNDDNWSVPSRCSGAQMETEADGSSSAQNKHRSEPETSANTRDTTRTAEETQHKCSICKKTFQNKHNLKIHNRVHTGDKPFSCTVCGKGFVVSSSLKAHMRTHTGERPYSCSICGKTYTQKTHLISHTRTHTGDRPFSCSVCGKTFIQSSHLKVHMIIHSKKDLTAVKPKRKASVDTQGHNEGM